MCIPYVHVQHFILQRKQQPPPRYFCIYGNIQQPPPLKGTFRALGVCVWPPSPPTNSRRKWKPLPLPLLLLLLSLLLLLLLLLLRACASFACCLGAVARVCVFTCLCMRVCVCVCVRLCISAALLLHEGACLHPCQLHLLHNHKMQCQCNANCTILWGQTKVYKSCMAASCSCALSLSPV